MRTLPRLPTFSRVPLRAGVRSKALARFLTPALVLAAGLACNTGSYPLDYFPEMHYQPSFRFQEPPRKMPAAAAVPYESAPHPEAVQSWRNLRPGEVNVDFGKAADLRNPVPRNQENLDRGRRLFQVNCSMCHGAQGKGDGVLAAHFQKFQQQPPRDLSQQQTQSRPEGQIFWIISNGLGNMPAFGNLLTEDERWLLTNAVREVR